VAGGGGTEYRPQRTLAEFGQLTDAGDALLVQRARGDVADTPESLHRQRMQELQFAVRRDQPQPVGLGDGAGHLGEELGAGDAHRDGQADPVADLRAQPRRDGDRLARDPAQPADVEKGLVDGDSLHYGRGVAEDLEDGLARLGVGRHPRWHHDRVRAQPARLPAVHRGAHPECLRLIARRQHHAAADDHRLAAQPRVVTLLDRGVERVEVGMQDRCLRPREYPGPAGDGRIGHEHMFA
jgi:hypothetical protein